MEQRLHLGCGDGTLVVRENGPRVVLAAEQPDDQQGLYKAYLKGRTGRLLLGTLMPENGRLCLRRTYSVDELRRKGCWPIEGAEVELAYSFRQAEQRSGHPSGPPGWCREREPCRLLGEPLLRHAARELAWGLVRRNTEGFELALPVQDGKQFPITPLFCFARIETIGTGRFAVYCFNEKGMPILNDGE